MAIAVSTPTLPTDVDDTMKRIILNAEDFLARTGSKLLKPLPNTATLFTSIDLPDPPSYLPRLLGEGVQNDVALEMDRAFQIRANELRQRSVISLNRACTSLRATPSDLPHSKLEEHVVSVFTELYTRQLSAWMDAGIALLRKQGVSRPANKKSPLQSTQQQQHPTSFNHVRCDVNAVWPVLNHSLAGIRSSTRTLLRRKPFPQPRG